MSFRDSMSGENGLHYLFSYRQQVAEEVMEASIGTFRRNTYLCQCSKCGITQKTLSKLNLQVFSFYFTFFSNPIFSAYFSRQWQDTLLLSFHNFLMLMFASMPAPRLADYWSTAIKLKKLKEENQVGLKLLNKLTFSSIIFKKLRSSQYILFLCFKVMRRKLGELQRNINKLSTSKDHDQTKKVMNAFCLIRCTKCI